MTTLQIPIPHSQRPFGPEETLVYYDGPQLFWLPVPEPGHWLCFGLPPDAGRWPFLVARLKVTQAEALQANTLTVRQACLAAEALYLMPDYDAEVLELHPLSTVLGHWLPGDVFLYLREGAR